MSDVLPQALDAENPSSNDIAWAAGIFEGEGCIFLLGDPPRRARLTVEMTDRDVVERFGRVARAGRIRLVKARSKVGDNLKPSWCCDIGKSDDVLRVLDILTPHFGERRKAKAEEAKKCITATIERTTRERDCAECGTPFRPMFSPSSEKAIFCTQTCANRLRNRRAEQRKHGR